MESVCDDDDRSGVDGRCDGMGGVVYGVGGDQWEAVVAGTILATFTLDDGGEMWKLDGCGIGGRRSNYNGYVAFMKYIKI